MQLTIIDVVNYSVRLGIIILGLIFIFGNVMRIPGNESFTTMMGVAFIVFGLYRSVLYYFKSRQLRREAEQPQEEGENV